MKKNPGNDRLPDIWKKKFFQSFIQEIQLYPEALENGQVLKSMKFKFPVFYQGQTIEEIRWDKENTVERVLKYMDGSDDICYDVDTANAENYYTLRRALFEKVQHTGDCGLTGRFADNHTSLPLRSSF